MTDEQVQELVANNLPHDNREFIRQVREGEQNDGPFMRGAFLVRDHVMSEYTLAKPSAEVRDE